jgi:pimeloyl-ACP methyl ester carboxylesterase
MRHWNLRLPGAPRLRSLAAASLLGATAAISAPSMAHAGRPAVPVPRWHGCDDGFYCATLRVPLDYRHPDRRSINIAVIEHRPTGQQHAIGSLLFNPGGPGGAGTQALPLAYPFFPARLKAVFNIVSFDPRGVGASTAVRCFPTAQAEERFFARLPAGFPVGQEQEQRWERAYAALSRRCEKTSGWLLPHLSTADVARDMEMIRRALGEQQLSYLGISYGTYLGAIYANVFPGRVRAMVLDSNVNPVAWATGDGTAHSLSVSLRLHADQGTAQTLDAFLDLCGRAGVSSCAFTAGNARTTRAKFSVLLRRLRSRPVTSGSPPATYTFAGTVSTVDAALAVPVARPGLAPGWEATAGLLQQLWEASTRNHAAGLSPLSAPASRPGHATTTPSPAPAYPGQEQQLAVTCSDSPNPRTPGAYVAEAARAQARYGAPALDWAWADEPCATWPATASDRYTGPWNRPTAHPILLIATTHDPALPYQDSLAMSRDLANARLLTVDGFGHTAFFNKSACADAYETAYLISGAFPPHDAVCHQNRAPFGRPTQRRLSASAGPTP